jgi:predicted dienelactone hydrolase
MQTIDLLLVVASVPLMVYWIQQGVHRKLVTLQIGIMGLFLHFIVSIVRWQLAPWYVMVVLVGLLEMVARVRVVPPSKRWVIAVYGLSLASLIAMLAFPVYPMPVASGPYAIGTRSQILVNEARIEQYGELAGQARTFKVQYWYPADTTEGFEQTKWIADGIAVPQALTRDWSLPFFVLDHIVSYESSAYLNAPISAAKPRYPIVIISHGWSSKRTLHTDLAEELASQGYLVVGVEHTYGSLATKLGENDDDFQLLFREALPPRAQTPNYLEFANLLVETYASDIIATIDTLEVLNQAPGAFQGRLDVSSIQVIGHSTGGGAAVKAAMDDNRITSVLGMDAWVEPLQDVDLNGGLSTRALYLRSNGWETGENNEYLYRLLQSSENASLLYQIDGTTHYDFAMVYMYSPLTRVVGLTGSVNAQYLNQLLETVMLEFLSSDQPYQIDLTLWPEVRIIPFG